ncbi:uncharacterized protein LOC113777351 [Coffea eugenioides]|uniref:uncharacterized protein LOC113777351 n=1 Tax=Coffea eugenioides TaxID=49369 RepID=UPI000F6146B5|nr:uncharacterized protein LOC113777351 [Coffea eugenioides]
MTNLEEMRKEVDLLQKEVEFQKNLADYWKRRWKQEYAEKIELLYKNIELEMKYKETSHADQAMTSRATCGYCGKPNHTENECWKKSKKCLYCGSTEHQISSCPSAPNKRKKYSAAN